MIQTHRVEYIQVFRQLKVLSGEPLSHSKIIQACPTSLHVADSDVGCSWTHSEDRYSSRRLDCSARIQYFLQPHVPH